MHFFWCFSPTKAFTFHTKWCKIYIYIYIYLFWGNIPLFLSIWIEKQLFKHIYQDGFYLSVVICWNETGFEVVDKGCCGVGRNNGQVTCLPLQQVCDDRSKYIFWDAFHPTEAANIILARKSYNSKSHSDVYPMNIQQLARARWNSRGYYKSDICHCIFGIYVLGNMMFFSDSY